MDKQRTNGTTREPADFIGKLYRRLIGANVIAFRWDGEFPVFTVRLAPSLVAGLRERARSRGLTLSAATAEAVRLYLDQVQGRRGGKAR